MVNGPCVTRVGMKEGAKDGDEGREMEDMGRVRGPKTGIGTRDGSRGRRTEDIRRGTETRDGSRG